MIKPIKKKCSMKNSSAMNVVYYSCLGVAVIISAYGYYEGYFVLGNRMSSLSLFWADYLDIYYAFYLF